MYINTYIHTHIHKSIHIYISIPETTEIFLVKMGKLTGKRKVNIFNHVKYFYVIGGI